MLKKTLISIKVLALLAGLTFVGAHLWHSGSPFVLQFQEANAQLSMDRQELSQIFGSHFLKSEFPTEMEIDWRGERKLAQIEYTFDPILNQGAQDLLARFKPDYGALVAIEPETGKILALASYTRDANMTDNLTFRNTFPAASIFKIVTAAAAIDKHQILPTHKISFNGGLYTLYRRNVLNQSKNRWSHTMTLREAFSKSVNTAFGRLAIEHLELTDLQDYSTRFLFNTSLDSDMPVQSGIALLPAEKDFHMAEIVSGYNRTTRMSPIQGGVIAATIANDGILRQPYLIQSMKTAQGESLYEAQISEGRPVMSAESAEKMRELMRATIESGTSRKSFRELTRSKKFSELDMGGKTGSLMGTEPRGKNDWFVGYGKWNGKQVAIASVMVNRDKWRVRSSYLGQQMIRQYFVNNIPANRPTVASQNATSHDRSPDL